MNLQKTFIVLLTSLSFSFYSFTQKEAVWNPVNGDGTYNNPVIHADYSDPDVIRVGDDYYMTASSFNHFPGLPVLHSKDLINWKLISHAVAEYPVENFDLPQPGNGIWAPAIRYHNNEFYIYFGDPDNGIYMTKAKHPSGPWQPLKLVKKYRGWIDTCPFWDDDGNAYLIHAWANSRSGIKHRLTLHRMSADGNELLDSGVTVFADSINHPTMEGPKIYKRNGWYYIFAPAGGVKTGWQTVLRSKKIFGPYEIRTVLEQGSTEINGPHQGGWIETQTGESWFIHFQDKFAYGRVVHLQPMHWQNDWPVMGEDFDGNGVGEPVINYKLPHHESTLSIVPPSSDEFDSLKLGLQWQWPANVKKNWYALDGETLNLFCEKTPVSCINLAHVPNLMLQKFPAMEFTVTALVDLSNLKNGESTGLIIFGTDYSYLSVKKKNDKLKIYHAACLESLKRNTDEKVELVESVFSEIWMRVKVTEFGGKPFCLFSYSFNGIDFTESQRLFEAKAGRWVGAKVGLFAIADEKSGANGFARYKWFEVKK